MLLVMYNESGELKKQYVFDGFKSYNTYYDYNEIGLLSGYRLERGSGAALANTTFEYDKNGNIIKIHHLNGSTKEYEYDLSNQLERETHYNASGTVTVDISYVYDAMGIRKSMTKGSTTIDYAYDLANQLTAINSVAIPYDDNGNMESNGTYGFKYNAEDQLISVTNASGATVGTYEYNHLGQRTKKVTHDKTEYYYYNGFQLAYITDENNQLRYNFTRDAYGKLLTMTDHTAPNNPVNYFYVTNQRGDVLGLKDKHGNMVVSYTYDAYGNILASDGTTKTSYGKSLATENPFRYASYFYDEESELYYLHSRYYDANLIRIGD